MVEPAALAAFIADNTAVRPVALVPELALHMADESTAIWQATERQLADAEVPPPFWAFAWAGGQALARHILDHPELVAGRRVFDFAAGSGLVALAALRAGARRVWANDIDPFACAAIVANARLNGLDAGLAVVDHDVTGAAPDAWGRIDLITAGDICYERDMAARVMAWL
ncbi:MAG: class I SAM-dependent methyltransferase, partial [Thalassobaculaceae bacterium]